MTVTVIRKSFKKIWPGIINYKFIKTKHVRGNQMSFMTKELSEEIMARSRLRSNYLIDK